MFAATSYAQVDRTFIFVDKAGNEIPSGSTVTADHVEIVGDDDDSYEQIESGVYVKNNTSEDQAAGVTVTLSRLDNGNAQCCFPATCIPDWGTAFGETRKTAGGVIKAGNSLNLQTEWFPEANGEAEVKLVLNVYEVTYKKIGNMTMAAAGNERDVENPTLTIKFVKSATGINDITASATATPIAYYSADGKRLSAPQKGLNIVRMSDGKTVKVVK